MNKLLATAKNLIFCCHKSQPRSLPAPPKKIAVLGAETGKLLGYCQLVKTHGIMMPGVCHHQLNLANWCRGLKVKLVEQIQLSSFTNVTYHMTGDKL